MRRHFGWRDWVKHLIPHFASGMCVADGYYQDGHFYITRLRPVTKALHVRVTDYPLHLAKADYFLLFGFVLNPTIHYVQKVKQ